MKSKQFNSYKTTRLRTKQSKLYHFSEKGLHVKLFGKKLWHACLVWERMETAWRHLRLLDFCILYICICCICMCYICICYICMSSSMAKSCGTHVLCERELRLLGATSVSWRRLVWYPESFSTEIDQLFAKICSSIMSNFLQHSLIVENFSANCPSTMRQENVRFHIFPTTLVVGRGFCQMCTSQHDWKERLDLSWLSLHCGLLQNSSSLLPQLRRELGVICANISCK